MPGEKPFQTPAAPKPISSATNSTVLLTPHEKILDQRNKLQKQKKLLQKISAENSQLIQELGDLQAIVDSTKSQVQHLRKERHNWRTESINHHRQYHATLLVAQQQQDEKLEWMTKYIELQQKMLDVECTCSSNTTTASVSTTH